MAADYQAWCPNCNRYETDEEWLEKGQCSICHGYLIPGPVRDPRTLLGSGCLSEPLDNLSTDQPTATASSASPITHTNPACSGEAASVILRAGIHPDS